MISTDVEPGFRSLGQPTARIIARRAAAAGRLERTLLVHGPLGSGKDAFVDDLLALAFCTASTAEERPCNACRGCRDARARVHPDLLIGSPERWREDRSTGESIVAAARRWLLDASGTPVAGNRRVILVERADGASEQIQNALLKALEEPGERHMFVLVADEPSRLLPTIRSRCQPLRIGPVERDELVSWLVERRNVPSDQADSLARIARGMSGTADRYARDPEIVRRRREVQAELLSLLDAGPAARFASVRDLLGSAGAGLAAPAVVDDPVGDDMGDAARPAVAVQRAAATALVETWSDLARDLIVAAAGRPELAAATELVPGLASQAARIGLAELVTFARLLERIHDGLAQNAAPRLALETAMLAWPTADRAGIAK